MTTLLKKSWEEAYKFTMWFYTMPYEVGIRTATGLFLTWLAILLALAIVFEPEPRYSFIAAEGLSNFYYGGFIVAAIGVIVDISPKIPSFLKRK